MEWLGESQYPTFGEFSAFVGFPDRELTHISEEPGSRRIMRYQDECSLFVIRGQV